MFLRAYGLDNIIDNYNIDDFVCKKSINYINISQNNTMKCGYIFNEYFSKEYINADAKYIALGSLCDILGIKNENKKVKTNTLILVLHGWGANSKLYENISKSLSNYGLVISPDFFGFGESEKLTEVYNVDKYAESIVKLLRLFEYDKLILFGHSFGARVIFSMINGNFSNSEKLAVQPDKIILTGAAGCKPRFSFKKYLKIKRYKCLKKKCKTNPKYVKILQKYGSNDYKSIGDEYLKQTFLKVVNTHQDNILHKINCPCLLLFGQCDRETPLYMAKKMLKKIENSKLIIIPNVGHFAFLDNFNFFIENVHKFMREID